jgi:two-component system cell cycle sensor histidine kinase/response regulator CckA
VILTQKLLQSMLPLSQTVPTGSATILLAEDTAALRGILVEFLTASGYTVLEAADAKEAVNLAAQHNGPIDILLTDIVMPGLLGTELLTEIRKSRPRIRPIFMSGYSDKKFTDIDKTAVYLQKPFALTLLAQKVKSALAGK